MAAPKARLDVWKPKLKNADGTVIEPERWVTCQTYEDLTTNKRRTNALTQVNVKDALYQPREAKLWVANRPHDFKIVYDATNATTRAATTYTYVYNDSDGNAAHAGNITLAHNWGLFTNFFYEFQHVRIVDQQTNLVLFTGRISKIDKKYEDSRGSIVTLECIDALDELRHIPCNNLQKKVFFQHASGSEWTRSSIVQYALNMGVNFQAANVLTQDSNGATRPDNSMTTPTATPLSGDFNFISNDAATSATENQYTRFERSAALLDQDLTWELEKTGNKSLLQEIIRFAIAEPHEDESADDQFGYNFFLDPNYGQYNLDATKGPGVSGWNPPMINYGKRGGRLSAAPALGSGGTASNQDPNVWGLKVHMPLVNSVVSQGHKGGTQTASKVMQRSFDFENPKEELFTGAVLTYEARDDNAVTDGTGDTDEPARIIRNKEFEICYVNYIDGTFTYRKKNIDDEWKKDNMDVPGTNSAEYLHAYQDNGSGGAGSLIKANCARVQYQSAVPSGGSNTGASPYHYILLSDISKDFPDASDQGNATHVILKGASSNTICRFNAKATEADEGRPRNVWGVRKIFPKVQMRITRPDELRIDIASRLAQASTQVRRGNFQFSKAPYYWLDCYVRTASTVTGGQEIQVAHTSGGASINVTPYGFREGMLIQKMTTDWVSMAKASGKDVYGYCWNMGSSYAMNVDMTESVNLQQGDLVRLIIPLRAGDIIRVDNALGDVFADHVITEVHYSEGMGPYTEIESVGNNEVRKGNPTKKSMWTELYGFEENEKKAVESKTAPRSTQAASYSGTFSYTANNQLSWSAGNITTGDGKTYQIVASSTSDTTHGIGSNGMQGTNKYMMYLDPDGENPNSNQYHVKTVLLSNYKQDADNIKLGVAQAGSGSAATPSVYGDQITRQGDGSPLKSEANVWVHTGTITETLIGNNAITTGKIAANAITADHIGANQITANKINAGEINATKLTTSFAAEVQGKVKSFAQAGIPTSVTIGDIWVDTDDDNKIYRAASAGADQITAGEWILVNDAVTTANAANATANSANNAVASKTTTYRQQESWKNSNNGSVIGDTLVATDTHRIWTWSSGNQWSLRDDPGAINNASTTINGGRIDTQAIVLTAGGGQCLSTGNAQGSGTRVLLSNAGIYGWNGGTSQFGMATSDGRAYFGSGVVRMASDGMTVGQQNASSNGTGTIIFKYISGSSTYTYNQFNYLGNLYISASGVSSPAISPTNNNQMSLGQDIFGFKQLYLGDTGGSATKLWNDAGTLKWGTTAVGTSGNQIINSGRLNFLAYYVDDNASPSDFSNAINGTDNVQSGVYYGWKHTGLGDITPSFHKSNGLGIGYGQVGSSTGVKMILMAHDTPTGGPGYTFTDYDTTGISHAVVGGGSRLVIEVTEQDVAMFSTSGLMLQPNKGIKPENNNQSYVGGNTTNAWTQSFGSDTRIGSGNFYDFSTSRKAIFHYAYGSTQAGGTGSESQGGHAIDANASRVHISCPLYYDNTHVAFGPPNVGGETTVDMEIITYNNSNKFKMVRATSTARAKDNIRDLEIDTSKIWDLKPRSFEWKGDGSTSFGLIAEEVDEVIPGLVAKYSNGWKFDSEGTVVPDKEEIPQSVHYKFLSVLLLAEMKELKARIEELEKEKNNG